MKITPTALPGVLVLEPRVFRDDRGFFYESFKVDEFAAHAAEGLPTAFKQDNHPPSTARVLRGPHYQLRRPQGKLVDRGFKIAIAEQQLVAGDLAPVAADAEPGAGIALRVQIDNQDAIA